MYESLVSIIIPAKNAESTIKKCLDSILNLDYAKYEVIVIDDGSNDSTPQLLAKYSPRIKIITNPLNLGPSRARNIAAKEAKGEYLAFTDADCIVDKNWLKELLAGFTTTDIVAVGGRQEIPVDESTFGRRVSMFLKKAGFISDYMHRGKTEIVPVPHNASCNVMYRKEVFLKEEGFLAGLWPGEDVEIDYRLRKKGYKLLFNPKAIVSHYRPKDLKSFTKMMYRYGWAQGFLVKRYGLFRKVHLLPITAIFCFLFFLFLILTKKIMITLFFILFISTALILYLSPTTFTLSILGSIYWHIGFIRGLINLKNK